MECYRIVVDAREPPWYSRSESWRYGLFSRARASDNVDAAGDARSPFTPFIRQTFSWYLSRLAYAPCHPQISRNTFPLSSVQGQMHDASLPDLGTAALNQSADSSGASGQSHATAGPLKHLPAMELAPFYGVRSSRWSGHGHMAATGRSNVTSFSPPTRAKCSSVASDTCRQPTIFGINSSNGDVVSAGAMSVY
jgi:hypothetical protein